MVYILENKKTVLIPAWRYYISKVHNGNYFSLLKSKHQQYLFQNRFSQIQLEGKWYERFIFAVF